jgi:NADPH:quinone reductase-like Zn-dependent oxidoreductase
MTVPLGKALIYKVSGDENFTWDENYRIKRSIGKKEVLIKTMFGGLNPLDYKIPVIYPFWLVFKGKPVGQDVCGKVIAMGDGVTEFKEGDIVFGHGPCCCEYSIVPSEEIAKVPSQTDSLPIYGGLCAAGVTALQMLRAADCFTESVPPKRIMIIGASGGVGSCAVQIAKSECPPGTTIIGVCSTKSVEYIKSLGAHSVIDYTTPGFAFAACVPEKSLDAIIDTVTSPDDFNYVPEGMKLIKESTGRYIASNTVKSFDWVKAMVGNVSGARIFRGQYELIVVRPNTADLDHVASLVEGGKLLLNVDEDVPFEASAIKAGLKKLSGRHVRGKLVIKL